MYNNNQEYVYFLCPKFVGNELNNEQIGNYVEDVMNTGLIVPEGLTLRGFVRVQDGLVEKYGINEVLKNFTEKNGSDLVSVVKVPKQYLAEDKYPDLNGQNQIDMPIPFFFRKQNEGNNSRIEGITRSLIAGVYSPKFEGEFVSNPNYNPCINPAGLLYSEEQKQRILDVQYNEWYQFAVEREDSAHSSDLRDKELSNGVWEQYYDAYKNIYPINPESTLAVKPNFKVPDSVPELN